MSVTVDRFDPVVRESLQRRATRLARKRPIFSEADAQLLEITEEGWARFDLIGPAGELLGGLYLDRRVVEEPE